MMMLVLANIYDVPELNIGFHFYMKSDDEDQERMRLRTSSDVGPKYTQQVDESSQGNSTRATVPPSDEEQQTLTHEREG